MLATGSHDNCQISVPIFQAIMASVAEIFKEFQKTRDDICDNDDLEANED